MAAMFAALNYRVELPVTAPRTARYSVSATEPAQTLDATLVFERALGIVSGAS